MSTDRRVGMFVTYVGPPSLRSYYMNADSMTQSTNSIGNLNELLGIRDQLSSRQVNAIKQHLLRNKPLPPTFFSDIEDLLLLESVRVPQGRGVNLG